MSKPTVADNKPVPVELKAGEEYHFCTCGRSSNQPFCDGSHAGTGLSPLEFVPTRTRTYYLCCCKQSAKAPICDGTHNRL